MPVTLPFFAALTVEDVRLIPCPTCNVLAGDGCVGENGEKLATDHVIRTELATAKAQITLLDDGVVVNSEGNAVGTIAGALTGSRLVIVWDYGVFSSRTATADEVDPGERSESPPSPVVNASGTTPRARVWAHYEREILIPKGMTRAFERKRQKVVDKALAVRPELRCCEAISGLAASPHHNGVNDRGKEYLDIRYALSGIGKEGDDERIDKMAEKAPAKSANFEDNARRGVMAVADFVRTLPSGLGENVWTLVQNVNRMHHSPTHPTLVSIGEQAQDALRERFHVAVVWDSSGAMLLRRL